MFQMNLQPSFHFLDLYLDCVNFGEGTDRRFRNVCKLRLNIYIYIYIYLTAIGSTSGGSGTVQIYTQTIQRIQRTEHT
jgi:hypothetical protein